jgi:acyl dehydratase
VTPRHFEDFVVGQVLRTSARVVSDDDIVRFAREFDPQPMHVDPEAAARGPFRGLIASGWHATSLLNKLIVEEIIPGAFMLGSPGVERIAWSRPLRPGDSIAGRVTIVEARRSTSRPGVGVVRSENHLIHAHDGGVVLGMLATGLYACRSQP